MSGVGKARCAQCLENNPQFRCAGCKITKYCSKICQVNHWKSTHKKQCKKLRNTQFHHNSTHPSKKQQKIHDPIDHTRNCKGENTQVDISFESKNDEHNCLQHLFDNNCKIKSCISLKTLKAVILEQQSNVHDTAFIDDYFHLLTVHHTNEEFEYISHQLAGYCNKAECVAFKRNYRNRENKNLESHKQSPRQQIIDKIHCYYLHSFDIGYRLTAGQRLVVDNNNEIDEKSEHEFQDLLTDSRAKKNS
eukprot:429589_1